MPQFYRVVLTNPPTEHDFLSGQALGVELRRPLRVDQLHFYAGVSVYDDVAAARQTAYRRWPRFGTYLARLDVPDGGEVEYAKSMGHPAHYTVWGEPADLLALVGAVTEIPPPAG